MKKRACWNERSRDAIGCLAEQADELEYTGKEDHREGVPPDAVHLLRVEMHSVSLRNDGMIVITVFKLWKLMHAEMKMMENEMLTVVVAVEDDVKAE